MKRPFVRAHYYRCGKCHHDMKTHDEHPQCYDSDRPETYPQYIPIPDFIREIEF